MARGRRGLVAGGIMAAALAAATGLPAQTVAGLALETVIGGDDGVIFGQATDVALLPGGRVAVLDGQAREIRVFGEDGTELRTLGGQGQGPGEIAGADEFAATSDGSIVLLDFGNRRISRWAPDGTYVGSTRFEAVIPSTHFATSIMEAGDALFVRSMGFRPGDTNLITRITPTWDAGETVFQWPTDFGADEPNDLSCDVCAWAPGPQGLALAQGDTMYAVQYVTPAGERGHVWRRDDLPAARRSDEEAEQLARRARQMRAQEGGPTAAEDAERFAYPHRFGKRRLVLDARGRLWTAPFAGPAQGRIDLFAPDGALLHSWALDHPVHALAVAGDRVAVGTETALGEPQVRVYRMR